MAPVRPLDPLPDWNPPDEAVEQPSTGKRNLGWGFEEPPSSKVFNALLRSAGRWLNYLATQAYIAPVDGAAGLYAEGRTTGAGLYGKGGPVGGRGVQGQGTGVGGSGGHFVGADSVTTGSGGSPGVYAEGTGERSAVEGFSKPGHGGAGLLGVSQGTGPAIRCGLGNMDFTGTPPAFSVGKANYLCQMNIMKAGMTMITGPGGGAILDGFNMSGVVFFTTSVRCNFAADFLNTSYIVSPNNTPGVGYYLEEVGRNFAWVEFSVRDRATRTLQNLTTLNFRIEFAAFGRQS